MKTHQTKRLCVLTGAGVSAESGLKTFRDNNGLWENHSVEEVATPEAFIRNRSLVYRFYNERRAQLQLAEVKPNAAHEALAKLEREWQGDFLLITQNVDNLHERAGSQKVTHMHGELLKARCNRCGQVSPWSDVLNEESICPHCEIIDHMRPHIVWFGEIPIELEASYQFLMHSDYFVSIGTSGHVYPAAGYVDFARKHRAHTIELNFERSQNASQFHEGHYGLASEIVPQWVDSFLAKQFILR